MSSGGDFDSVQKFALLFISEEKGSVIKYANKPSGIGRYKN